MKYYLKQGVFPFIYQLFMAMIAFGILAINELIWLKILLAVLNIALYLFIVAAVAYKDGQQALEVQMANDLERREIIRTGEDRPLKLHEEYKPWKGFVFGLISCVPILLFLILHTIVYNATGSYSGLGAIAGIIGLMFFIFFRLNASSAAAETASISWYTYYGTLVAVPILMLTMGIAYIMGAKKIMRQQEMIREKQRKIYGDNV
ncbi:MAG: hypothetical protein VZQ61_05435 [Christensenellaceae bacterium]